MKPYGNKKATPQRMARKRMRRDVFVANRKESKLRREARRLLRQQALETASESE